MSDLIQHFLDIFYWLDMYETWSVFLHSWESMEILNEMFPCFHHPFAILPFPEESPMLCHRLEDLTQSRFIIIRQETPWIPERCTSDHKAIEIEWGVISLQESVCRMVSMYVRNRRFNISMLIPATCYLLPVIRMHHLPHPIVITYNITVTDHGNIQMLPQFIYPGEISLSSKGLLVCPTMDSDEIGSRVFESLAKIYEQRRVFPAETSFYRNRDFDGFRHLFHDPECGITIDHERWAVSTFDDFFCGTTHIDIDSSDSIAFYNLWRLCEFQRIFPKNLDNEWIFTRIMGECLSLKILRMDESISRVEFWEYHCFWCYPLHNLTIWTITISIHRCESRYGSSRCQVRPEDFVHRWLVGVGRSW